MKKAVDSTSELQELRKIASNKRCFDCNQAGTTYAVPELGIFLCSICGGIHREFNHRVKGLSTCNFTEIEVSKLKSMGNEKAALTWMARHDPRGFPVPDLKDSNKLKDFLKLKYLDKRFYENREAPAPAPAKPVQVQPRIESRLEKPPANVGFINLMEDEPPATAPRVQRPSITSESPAPSNLPNPPNFFPTSFAPPPAFPVQMFPGTAGSYNPSGPSPAVNPSTNTNPNHSSTAPPPQASGINTQPIHFNPPPGYTPSPNLYQNPNAFHNPNPNINPNPNLNPNLNPTLNAVPYQNSPNPSQNLNLFANPSQNMGINPNPVPISSPNPGPNLPLYQNPGPGPSQALFQGPSIYPQGYPQYPPNYPQNYPPHNPAPVSGFNQYPPGYNQGYSNPAHSPPMVSGSQQSFFAKPIDPFEQIMEEEMERKLASHPKTHITPAQQLMMQQYNVQAQLYQKNYGVPYPYTLQQWIAINNQPMQHEPKAHSKNPFDLFT